MKLPKPLQDKLIEVVCREIAERSVKALFDAGQRYVERTIEKGRQVEVDMLNAEIDRKNAEFFSEVDDFINNFHKKLLKREIW